jgi:hypothetical protein
MKCAVLAVAALTCCSAFAQAPAWLPPGPDRVLTEAELLEVFIRPGRKTRIVMTGGATGRKYEIELQPSGELQLAIAGGANIGRDWKVDTGALCLRAYQNQWAGVWNCGSMELQDGRLYWIDEHGNQRNVIDDVQR